MFGRRLLLLVRYKVFDSSLLDRKRNSVGSKKWYFLIQSLNDTTRPAILQSPMNITLEKPAVFIHGT